MEKRPEVELVLVEYVLLLRLVISFKPTFVTNEIVMIVKQCSRSSSIQMVQNQLFNIFMIIIIIKLEYRMQVGYKQFQIAENHFAIKIIFI